MNYLQQAILFAAFEDELEKISSSEMPGLPPAPNTGWTERVARPEHQNEAALERRTKAQGDYTTKPGTRVPRPGKRRGETIEERWNIETGRIETGDVPQKGRGTGQPGGRWPAKARKRDSLDGWRKPTMPEAARNRLRVAAGKLKAHLNRGHLPGPPK